VYFYSGSVEPQIGETIEDASGETGIVQAVLVTSGDWSSGNASGRLEVSNSTDVFSGSLYQDSVDICTTFSAAYQIRGYERLSTWASGETVRYYPPLDLKTLPPSSGKFNTVSGARSPLFAATDFDGWTSGADHYAGPTMGSVGPGDMYGIVLRRFLIEGSIGTLESLDYLEFNWE
jgi:hypothetical protein